MASDGAFSSLTKGGVRSFRVLVSARECSWLLVSARAIFGLDNKNRIFFARERVLQRSLPTETALVPLTVITFLIPLSLSVYSRCSNIPAILTSHNTEASSLLHIDSVHTDQRHRRAEDSPRTEPSPPGTLCTRFSDQASEELRHTCRENVQSGLSIKTDKLIKLLGLT